MRISDFNLHFGQILTALELTKTQRKSLVRKLIGFGLGTTWVAFETGVSLCQATGLSEELQPLFSRSSHFQPNPMDNIFLRATGFATLVWEGHIIAYRPSKRSVNATNLLGLGKKPREFLECFLRENPEIEAKECSASVHRALNGMYIADAHVGDLCRFLHVDGAVAEALQNA
jgi:hypothetical protein